MRQVDYLFDLEGETFELVRAEDHRDGWTLQNWRGEAVDGFAAQPLANVVAHLKFQGFTPRLRFICNFTGGHCPSGCRSACNYEIDRTAVGGGVERRDYNATHDHLRAMAQIVREALDETAFYVIVNSLGQYWRRPGSGVTDDFEAAHRYTPEEVEAQRGMFGFWSSEAIPCAY